MLEKKDEILSKHTLKISDMEAAVSQANEHKAVHDFLQVKYNDAILQLEAVKAEKDTRVEEIKIENSLL